MDVRMSLQKVSNLKVLALSLAIALIDQISKWAIINFVMNPPRVIPLTDFLNVVLTRNYGVSFSLFYDKGDLTRWLLIGVSSLITLFLAWWLTQLISKLARVGVAMIVGGALGNIADRVLFGGVTDFIDFHYAGIHFPAFNVADSAITIGVALFIFDSLRNYKEWPK